MTDDRGAWEQRQAPALGKVAPRETSSGIPLRPLYVPADAPVDYARDLGFPGEPPFTRGVYPTMYRGQTWTMRQYAGFGSAAQTNARFRYLLERGQTGLSVAFDLPTQMGYDSDHPRAAGEVGRVGVAVSTLDDMAELLDGLPLDRVTTSMTINATAPVLLGFYVAVAEARGIPRAALGGTVQNDLLKEYVARGTYIYPPAGSLRLATDLIAFCVRELPRWNPISISGYHMREAGATAVQELAFTLADGLAYVRAAVDRGLDVDAIAPRLSFFFSAHSHLFEEVAKFRAARRLWARLLGERFGPRDPKSLMLRFHAQTAGSTLTAQQPENNVVRTTLEALGAVLGGAQSLHTNSYDEALGLPTEGAVQLALRTQQLLAAESGAADTVDPLAGAYFVETLTDDLERRALAYLEEIERRGGMLRAIESGYVQHEIHLAAYRHQQEVEAGHRPVVGVNCFVEDAPRPENIFRPDPRVEAGRAQRLAAYRAGRNAAACGRALAALAAAAGGGGDLMEPTLAAIRAHATLGEISDRLRAVFGEHRPTNQI